MRLKAFLALCVAVLFAVSVFATGQVHEAVLYSFGSNPNDGNVPNGGLVFDSAGNLYGTAQGGGANGRGIAFELTPAAGGTWTETIIYNFCSQPNCADGDVPRTGLIFDRAGNLYGTTAAGGTFFGGTCRGAGCGTVFELAPPSIRGGIWTETVLWDFEGSLNGDDGSQPLARLTWDAAGNLYGTTVNGGSSFSLGTVFELSPSLGGGWNESVLYAFCVNGPPCTDGAEPAAGVSFDKSGNLFGTTYEVWGSIFELSLQAGGVWTETTLHKFGPHAGGNPISEVNIDQSGNLYGTVSDGEGTAQCGGVWRLSPQSGGGYSKSILFLNPSGVNGCTPLAGVFLDSNGTTAFGTASTGSPHNGGTLFTIIRGKETVLYDFCQLPGCADGSTPAASLTLHDGSLFSTTSAGGAFNQGVIFRATP